MTERAVMMSGMGGQGVQLAARTLAVAAVADGLEAMVFGEYAGMMRGGNTDATVVLATDRVRTPPTVSRAWGAVAMHHAYWGSVGPRLVAGSIVLVDTSVFKGNLGRTDLVVVEVRATETATDLGSRRAGSMVALGALAAATGLVGVESLVATTAEVLPSYRAQHAETNAIAIRAGYALVPDRVLEAWPTADTDALATSTIGASR